MDAMSFGTRNFVDLNLGDPRRTKRLIQSVDAMCRHPGGTLPDKLSQPKQLRAFYRLMDRDEVTHEVVLWSHAEATRRRIAALGTAAPATVLILHDATELDYTTLKALQERLGPIGQGTRRGYICHNSLAVVAHTGQTLGLTSQILHHRATVPAGETTKQSRERGDRESRLWLRGAQASGPAPAGVRCVDVCDSLADTFEFLSHEMTQGRHFVVRARENRKLREPAAVPDAPPSYLFEVARQWPTQGSRVIVVKPSSQRAGREATVQVSFGKACLALPAEKLGDYPSKPLDVWVVRVWEQNTPANEAPLEWILLTNCPVETVADADERIDWYEKRWIIEEFHKGMKTGCGIETMQFDTIERLEPAIAVISVVATTLLELRDAARAADADTRPATDVVAPVYVAVLSAHYGTRLGANPSVKKFYLHVARLGGHQNRKCDGLPGWITLWRGWMKLQSMVDGYEAALSKTTRTCGKN